ncbi:MAG TPA: DUF192 domain-containing protein [Actinomycetota bacterium]|nr:DUF192 domain-containing protein [Actinomycetota bacterium]
MHLIDPNRPGSRPVQLLEARGMLAGMQGLLGQSGLPPATGLLLKTKEVHTIGMRFAIDTVYLAKDGRVLRVDTMPPGRIGPVMLKARWILELAAGEAQRLGIAPGTTLQRAGG